MTLNLFCVERELFFRIKFLSSGGVHYQLGRSALFSFISDEAFENKRNQLKNQRIKKVYSSNGQKKL